MIEAKVSKVSRPGHHEYSPADGSGRLFIPFRSEPGLKRPVG